MEWLSRTFSPAYRLPGNPITVDRPSVKRSTNLGEIYVKAEGECAFRPAVLFAGANERWPQTLQGVSIHFTHLEPSCACATKLPASGYLQDQLLFEVCDDDRHISKRLLIAEDDSNFRQSLTVDFEARGYRFATASSCADTGPSVRKSDCAAHEPEAREGKRITIMKK